MSGEVSRRRILRDGAAAAGVFMAASLGLGTGGCANQYECTADGRSTVLELAMSQIGEVSTTTYLRRRGRTYVRSLGGYNPSAENSQWGWTFEVNGHMPEDSDTNAATYVPEEGATVLWQVAEAA